MTIDDSKIDIRGGAATLRVRPDRRALVVDSPGREPEVIEFRPRIDLSGGGELVVSGDERHVALFGYSGQSSQGYELFRLDPLAHLGGFPDTQGEGAAPLFSPDGRWLVMAMSIDAPVVRGTGEYFEEVADDDSDAPVVIDWARLVVQQVDGGEPVTVPVGVEAAVSTDLDTVLDWNTYAHPLRFTADDVVVVTMPWGEEIPVSLPPAGPVTGRGFAAV
jgi:hypothetical protein